MKSACWDEASINADANHEADRFGRKGAATKEGSGAAKSASTNKPHFLYNTLDTILWLARKSGAHEVTEVVDSLSRLFRIGLSKGNEVISLMEEFEHVKSYLIIQKTRYKEKLNYSIVIDPSLH